MKLNIIMLLAFLLTVTSCSIVGSDSNKSTIVGEWEWIKSTGGFAGHTITPDSPGYSKQQLHFGRDDEFSFFRADTLVTSGQYSLSKESDKIMIEYNTGNSPHIPDQWVELNKNDILVLNDRCADCYTSTYKRGN
ncbi:hypothetical protein [Fodinibius sp.]|uniref:hypothetical protein n=1 Tax=Fodinibius sp. TaxID=1872440 RepID=UPI002ACDA592|nr:hypothetical protein [Fodinibius sp.]MDZ7660180.1 hypothetical protein [Fodinibius sp.]